MEDMMNKALINENDLKNIQNETLRDCCRQMITLFDNRNPETLEQCNDLYRNALEKVKKEMSDDMELFDALRPFAKALVYSCMFNYFKLPLVPLDDIIALGEKLVKEHPTIHFQMPRLIEDRHNTLYLEDLEESAKHTEDYRRMMVHYQAVGENKGVILRMAIDCYGRIISALSLSDLPENHSEAKKVELEMLEYIDQVLSCTQHPLQLVPKGKRETELFGKNFVCSDFSMICPEHTTEEIEKRVALVDQMKEKYPFATEFLNEVRSSLLTKRKFRD